MIPGIVGKKLGMSQIFTEDGRAEPVTAVQAGPCAVIQVKTVDSDGYNAVQLGFDEKKPKRTTRPLLGHFAKCGTSPKRFIREFRADAAPRVGPGDTVGAAVLEGAILVDVQGVSKGKGWAGTIKRWNFSRGRMSHGASKSHRQSGSIGRTYGTAKGVPKGKKMAGHMGNEKVSTVGLKVVEIDAERDLLLVKGAVPGANGGYLVIKRSYKDKSTRKLSSTLY